MLSVHHYLAIRVAFEKQESKRSIARRLHHSQKTVARAIASPTGCPEPYRRSRPPDYPKLGPYLAKIDAILAGDESAPVKQRHTAMQIYRRLVKEEQYAGKYDQVRRYVNKHRQARRETLIPLCHEAGQRMECDFGQIAVDYPEGRRKTDVLVVTWSFSHAVFMVALPNQRSESVLSGMVSAFDFFGCLAREVWWDNPRTIATVILRGRDRVLNEDYAALASHYRFEPCACMPGKGQEKPDAESGVKALQRRFGTPVPQARDLAELNQQLLAFCRAELDRTVSGQSQTIGQRFELDRQQAIGLPAHRFDACISKAVRIDKYQTATFEHNRYSVPKWAAFSEVTVKAYTDRIEIVQGQQVLARHARSYGRDQWIVDPLHYLAALSARPHALDHSAVFRDWRLPEIFGQLRQRLEREHGANAGMRQFVRVLQMLGQHSAERLAEAIARLWHRVHLRSEQIEAKADELARIAPVVKNDSSAARKREAVTGEAVEGQSLPGDTGAVKNGSTTGAGRYPSVHLPPPDLRRFNQLLSSFTQGEHEHVESIATAVAAQPQGPEAAHDAGRAREAGPGGVGGQRGLPGISAASFGAGTGQPGQQCPEPSPETGVVPGDQGTGRLRLCPGPDGQQAQGAGAEPG
jgi:transposase